jgi:hypothetical protein
MTKTFASNERVMDSRSRGQDLNPGPPAYEEEVLATGPQRLAKY